MKNVNSNSRRSLLCLYNWITILIVVTFHVEGEDSLNASDCCPATCFLLFFYRLLMDHGKIIDALPLFQRLMPATFLGLNMSFAYYMKFRKQIGHFRVLMCLCFKTSLSAKPFL